MTPALGESRLVVLSGINGNSDGIVFLPGDREKITVGSDFTCDVRYIRDGVRSIHFFIYRNERGEIKVANNCTSHPILVNEVEVPTKKILVSGDVITLFEKNLRWELNEDAKKRKLSLPKTERKRQAAMCLKTKKRVTIHGFRGLMSKKPEATSASDSLVGDEQPIETAETTSDEKNAEAETPTTPTKGPSELPMPFSTPLLSVSRNKENVTVTCSPKLESLNLSGTLKTWFTPLKSTSKKTPMKQALGEATSNASDSETTPTKAKKSMYLIDLTTPHPTKKGVSSPSTSQSPKITPTKKTVVARQENTLLKSAIKNSTIKKKIEATPNRKVLTFAETDALQESGGSSLIEISMDSESPINGSGIQATPAKSENKNETADFTGLQEMLKTPLKEPTNHLANASSVARIMNTPGATEQTKNVLSADDNEAKEVQELIDSISSVLDEQETANHSDESLEHNESQTAAFEGSFNKALEGNTSSPSQKISAMVFDDNAMTSAENKFENIAGRPSVGGMSSIDSKFDSLLGRPLISKTYEPAKKSTQPDIMEDVDDEMSREKAESILSWVATARDSLAAESSNPVTQVNSSRYSNVTNESVVSVKNLAYDATTPKIVNLQPIEQLRKTLGASTQKLTKSPVTRLSLNENNVVVENYCFNNNDIQKSLRSTRKRIGIAMSMMHNTSHQADTTIDPNETINLTSAEADLDLSKQEPVSILSLDNQPQSSSNGGEDNLTAEESNQPLNNYIMFANSDDVPVESEKDIFEVSSNDESAEELLSQSDGYDSSSESDGSEEMGEVSTEVIEKSKSLTKFRLSEQDMEDGVCPLNDSRTDEEVPSSQEADVTTNDEGAAQSTDQSSLFCKSAIVDVDDKNVEMVEVNQSQSSTANEEVASSQETMFDSDFDIPATQIEVAQRQVENLQPETIAEEESVLDSQETATSSDADLLEDVTQNDTADLDDTEIDQQLDGVDEDQPSESVERLAEETFNLGADETPDRIDGSILNNNQSSAQADVYGVASTQDAEDDFVFDAAGGSAHESTLSKIETMIEQTPIEEVVASEIDSAPVEEEASELVEQPSEIEEEITSEIVEPIEVEKPSEVEEPSEKEEQPSRIDEAPVDETLEIAADVSEVVDDNADELAPDSIDLIADESSGQVADDTNGSVAYASDLAGNDTLDPIDDESFLNNNQSARVDDFEIPATQDIVDEQTTIDESTADESDLSVLAASKDETVITDSNRVIPSETSIFTDSEFSRVDIPDELMETTAALSDDELKGLTDAPTFTKRAPSMTPLAGVKIVLSRKTVAAQPEGEVSSFFVDDLKQQHKEAMFNKMEEQQNVEAMCQRKSLAPLASVKPTDLRKTLIPAGTSLKPSFENFMKAKAQQLKAKEKEVSDMEISPSQPSVDQPTANSSVESSLQSADIEVDSPTDGDVTIAEDIRDGSSATTPNAQDTIADIKEPSQPDEEDFGNQEPVVEEVCVKKTAYVCTIDDDEAVEPEAEAAEPEVEVVEPEVEALAPPVETPAVPETPSRRRGVKIDYSALASGNTPRKLGETPKTTGTPHRRGRSASIDSKASVENTTASVTKRARSVKKLAPVIQEEPENHSEAVLIEDSSQDENYEKALEAKAIKKRGRKLEETLEPATEVRVEISGKLMEEPTQSEVESILQAADEVKTAPESEADKQTPEEDSAPAQGEPSGRQRRGARVNYTDLAAGSKLPDTPKRARKVRKESEDAPAKVVARPATPVKVPEKSKRARKEVVAKPEVTPQAETAVAAPVTGEPDMEKIPQFKEIVADDDVEVATDPVEKKRGRAKQPVELKVSETSEVAATTSRRVVSKRKNAEPQEQETSVKTNPEDSPVQNKRKRRAASPAPEEPVEPRVRKLATKKQASESQSSIQVPPAATTSGEEVLESTEEPVKRRGRQLSTKKASKSNNTVETPVLTATRALRATSRAKTPELAEIQLPQRQGRRERVQSVDEPKEEAPAAAVKPTARNKRKLETESTQALPEAIEELAPTTSRRGKKQEAEIAPEPVVQSLPKTTSRRNAKKAEDPPVEVSAAKTSRRGAAKKVEEPAAEIEEPVTATPAKKSRRGAAKKVEEAKEEIKEPVAATPAKKSRREVAKKVEEPVEEGPVKKTKGKAKKPEVVEIVEIEPEASAKRGRGKKAAEPEAPVVAEPPAKRGAAKKQVTIATPPTPEAAEAKPTRGTKRNPPAATEEPVAKRSTRARK